MTDVVAVAEALNTAFERLVADQPADTYVSVTASWQTPADKLISMTISTAGVDDDPELP